MLACAGTAGAQTTLAGGTSATPPPKLRSIACQTLCAGTTTARAGSVVLVKGRNLETVTSVTLLGRRKAGDETVAAPQGVSATSLSLEIPSGARSGRLMATTAEGAESRRSRQPLRVERVVTRKVGGNGGPGLEIGVTGRKVFFGADRRPTLTYTVEDSEPVRVVVEVIRSADGVAVAGYDQGVVAPGEPRTQSWDGFIAGDVAGDGRYEFRVVAQDSAGVMATSAQAAPPEGAAPPSPDSFMFLGHKFPVRGNHDYGEFAASFGGGRGHQGQDVFARCGTPLAAARGGVVRFKQFHSRAGHYVVIDGEETDFDYVYMHMRQAALVDKGDRVQTGQVIGRVGDTGRAHGCHLHFELWSGPGWYTGGSPFDPLALLRAWDEYS